MADLKINENLYSSSDANLSVGAMLGNVRLISECYTMPTYVSAATTTCLGFNGGINIYDHSCIEIIPSARLRIKRSGTYIFIFAHRAKDNCACEMFGIRLSDRVNTEVGNWSYPLTAWCGGTSRSSHYSCEAVYLEAGTELDAKLYSETAAQPTNRVDYLILTTEPYEEEGLPEEYQEIKYLESSGTQYLNINIRLSVAFGFDIKFYAKSPVQTSSGYGAIFGCRYASGDRDYQLSTYGTYAGGIMRWGNATGAGSSGGSMSDPGIVRNTVQTCSLKNKVFTQAGGGTEVIKGDNLASPADCYLFGLNNNGTFAQAGSGCRIYYAKFWTREGELIRDLVPCKRKSDNVLGMYDKIDRIFFTNAGSGTFTAGPNVN